MIFKFLPLRTSRVYEIIKESLYSNLDVHRFCNGAHVEGIRECYWVIAWSTCNIIWHIVHDYKFSGDNFCDAAPNEQKLIHKLLFTNNYCISFVNFGSYKICYSVLKSPLIICQKIKLMELCRNVLYFFRNFYRS